MDMEETATTAAQERKALISFRDADIMNGENTVSASITAGDYLFRASGFRVSFDGFTALYEESTDDAKKKETALPPLEEGQTLKLKKLTADQKFTQPPPLYTEATLIHALR